MTDTLKTISPVDGRIYVERPLETAAGIDRALELARRGAARVGGAAARRRAARCSAGRSMPSSPRRTTSPPRSPGRWAAPSATRPARSAASRSARATCWALAPAGARARPARRESRLRAADQARAARRRRRRGAVELPLLTAVNAVMPALIAGNAVVLKHSHQTPLCAERFHEAFAAAGVAGRRVPVPAPVACRHGAPDGRPARRERLFHRLGVGRPRRRRGNGRGLCDLGPRARRQGSRLRARRRRPGARRSTP